MSDNLLKHEKSPYLLQHADNPVHWRPWGKAALEEARRLDRPILLSVGYAACHWCHVMAHESFEDAGVATVMNDHFVNIKVDREERPEIDQLYMQALHALGEQGGWPLTMFLTPAGEPFWGGTYFPKEPRYGRPGFVQVLTEIARLYREERQRVTHNSEAIATALAAAPGGPGGELDPRLVAAAGARLVEASDPVHGGLKGAPKFPQAPLLEVIEHAAYASGEERHLTTLHHALRQMCRGGIYDHLGGGFARYSVDERWLVPHFEKMLYDNAQLVALLTRAFRRTGDAVFRRAVEETVGWLEREMIAEGGAFAASLDADSEGEEGKFYVWSLAEVAEVLGEEADFFAAAYDITAAGNFEGHNIPNRLRDTFPRLPGEEAMLETQRRRLMQRREGRVRPGRDDKILTDWNGLMIAALADAATTFERPEWLALARRAYDFIVATVSRETRLGHSHREGVTVFPGIAGDHAAMARAALALDEAAPEPGLLAQAASFLDALHAHHLVEGFGYVLAADDAEDVTTRIRSAADEAVPNANGVAVDALIRLHHATGERRWIERADELLAGLAPQIVASPFAHASLLAALDLRVAALQLVVTGEESEAKRALIEAARGSADPNRLVMVLKEGAEPPEGHPAHGKAVRQGAAAFLCRGTTCSLPMSEPAELRAALARRG